MKYIFFLFLSLNVFFGNGQSENKPVIYLDQDLSLIDSIEYHEKAISALYFGSELDQDSIIVKRLIRKYDFGNFNSTKLGQVQNLLRRELGVENFEKNIILFYKDSILGYNEFNNSIKARALLDEMSIVTKQEYLSRRTSFNSKQKKCRKFAKKLNTKPFYVYSEKINFDYVPKNYEHHQISKTLKSIFFKYDFHGVVILKPNGDYFFYTRLLESQVKKMLKDDWTEYITDFNLAKSNPQIRVLKFIDDMNRSERIQRDRLVRIEIEKRKREREREQNKNQFRSNNNAISLKISSCYGYPRF
ncbi:hypothetical protein [Psychroserpens damuponensis]|uniref:hypothetical protein n=1 Tax=Psychroserpens damuponensis TaxID=943936 RepID=UPI00058D0E31|nr:hypothetical protein [Psychroserpens damuponensis]